jgi:hypothetical protein
MVALAAVAAAFAFLYVRQVPALEALIPEEAEGVAVVDAAWLWDASADVRALPEARRALEEVEREAGISLEQDVAPWIGLMGVAVLRTEGHDPQAVALAQVRDWAAFARCQARLRSRPKRGAEETWTNSSYHGVELQRVEWKDKVSGEPEPPITLAWVKGWALVGIGEGAVEKAIDTYQGRTASLQKNAAWTTAGSRLPRERVLWAGVDMRRVNAAFDGEENSISPRRLRHARRRAEGRLLRKKLSDTVVMSSLSDMGNGLRLDSVNAPRTEQGRAHWKKMEFGSRPVSGALLAQVPRGTTAALLLSDPNALWQNLKSLAMEGMDSSAAREEAEKSLRELAPAEAILKQFTGDFGVALIARPGSGFGLVALAQGKGAEPVRRAASDLSAWLEKNDQQLNKRNDLYTFAEGTTGSEVKDGESFPFTPCFGSRNDLLVASTHPEWLDDARAGAGEVRLAFPAGAEQADLVLTGTFQALDSLLSDSDRADRADRAAASLGPGMAHAIRDLGLQRAQWGAWLAGDREGRWQQATLTVTDWPWRDALKRGLAGLQRQQTEQ